MITLTKTAATEIRKVMAEKGLPSGSALRLAIKGGGCAGFTYLLDFENQRRPFDEEFSSEGITIFVDRKSLIYIAGTTVDFNTSLTERGFKFDNPLAVAGCGCGTSFTPKARMMA